jgi:hypothetical protein
MPYFKHKKSRGHPLKGGSREKTPLLAKKSPFLLGHSARITKSVFDKIPGQWPNSAQK